MFLLGLQVKVARFNKKNLFWKNIAYKDKNGIIPKQIFEYKKISDF